MELLRIGIILKNDRVLEEQGDEMEMKWKYLTC